MSTKYTCSLCISSSQRGWLHFLMLLICAFRFAYSVMITGLFHIWASVTWTLTFYPACLPDSLSISISYWTIFDGGSSVCGTQGAVFCKPWVRSLSTVWFTAFLNTSAPQSASQLASFQHVSTQPARSQHAGLQHSLWSACIHPICCLVPSWCPDRPQFQAQVGSPADCC